MSPAEYSLMKELEKELNRGCPSGFRLSQGDLDWRAQWRPRVKTRTAVEDGIVKRVYRFKKSKGGAL